MNAQGPPPETSTERQPARAVRADGLRRRQAILTAAVSMATVEGLEGLSIGDLARSLGMSKSGVYAHFGSKEDLQLATVDEAGRIFTTEVVAPALRADAGIDQLVAVCEAFVDHLRRRVFPGGCFFAGAALEMGTRPGPVKEAVAGFQREFVQLLSGFAAAAVAAGQLPPDEDPAQLAFDLNGIMLGADVGFVLRGDEVPLAMARRAVGRRLGLTA
jgi:AcrR family transcriptional regulator